MADYVDVDDLTELVLNRERIHTGPNLGQKIENFSRESTLLIKNFCIWNQPQWINSNMSMTEKVKKAREPIQHSSYIKKFQKWLGNTDPGDPCHCLKASQFEQELTQEAQETLQIEKDLRFIVKRSVSIDDGTGAFCSDGFISYIINPHDPSYSLMEKSKYGDTLRLGSSKYIAYHEATHNKFLDPSHLLLIGILSWSIGSFLTYKLWAKNRPYRLSTKILASVIIPYALIEMVVDPYVIHRLEQRTDRVALHSIGCHICIEQALSDVHKKNMKMYISNEEVGKIAENLCNEGCRCSRHTY